jgi:hypothetical protein
MRQLGKALFVQCPRVSIEPFKAFTKMRLIVWIVGYNEVGKFGAAGLFGAGGLVGRNDQIGEHGDRQKFRLIKKFRFVRTGTSFDRGMFVGVGPLFKARELTRGGCKRKGFERLSSVHSLSRHSYSRYFKLRTETSLKYKIS